jgi:hypothetical protein
LDRQNRAASTIDGNDREVFESRWCALWRGRGCQYPSEDRDEERPF